MSTYGISMLHKMGIVKISSCRRCGAEEKPMGICVNGRLWKELQTLCFAQIESNQMKEARLGGFGPW